MSGTEEYTELDVELQGQYGRLTLSQRGALVRLKEKLAAAGHYRPGKPADEDEPEELPSHDDVTILRFLRGKAFDIPKASAQFIQTEEWRKAKKASECFAKITPEDLRHTRQFFPPWTGRRDKHGRPLYVWKLSTIGPLQKQLNELTAQDQERRMIALYESLRLFIMRACSCIKSEAFPTPVGATTNIIDLEGVSLSLIWSMRSHFQASAKLAGTAYPEFLARVFIVNAPSFFSTAWGYIKGYFDEGTRRKVFILGSNPAPDILKYVNAADLPKAYGGELDWVPLDPPKLDDDLKVLFGRDEFPEGPNVFVADSPTTGRIVPFELAKASELELQHLY